jgi:transcription termination factor Rho
MNLTELKQKPIAELVKIAESMNLDSMARNRKQDVIFAILKRHAMNGEEIYRRWRIRNFKRRLWFLAVFRRFLFGRP